MDKYIFIIDTDSYSGNFEREMTAYLTGRTGECDVGREQATLFRNEVGEGFDNVIDVANEHGCSRPCSIWTTPGWSNDGDGHFFQDGDEEKAQVDKYPAYMSVAIFFDSIPTDEQIILMKKRVYVFAKNRLKVSGFRLLQETVTTKEISV